MSKTWKDQPRNVIAKDLRTPKYRRRVVPDKRKEVTETEMLSEEDYWKEKEREYRGDWW